MSEFASGKSSGAGALAVSARTDNELAPYDADGDALASGSTRSLGNAVKDACKILMDDWYEREEER